MRKDLKLKVKKLQLNRETLRGLEQTDLSPVLGGATGTACASFCLGSCGCTQHNTCTTRLC